MQEPIFRSFDEMPEKELIPGFFAKPVHTPGNTINFITVSAVYSFPLHQHTHHQCAFVLQGEFEMTINGETRVLGPGQFAVIPPNTPHSGRSLTNCRLMDIFHPAREDYKW